MADGTIRLPADSTGKFLDTTELTVGANTVERERLVIAGDGSTELADVKSTVPTSAMFGLVVRPAMGSTTVTLGSVALLSGTSGLIGTVNVSTAAGGASIDPRQVTVIAGTSGAGIGTIISTAAGSAAIDPRLVTLQAGTTALIGAVAFATVSNNVSLWSSSGVNISASTVAPSSDGMGMFVRMVNASSGMTGGNIMLSTGFNTAAIDPRQATIIGGTSGAGVGTIVSTAVGAAAIDPRQATIVAATSGAVLWTVGAGSSGVTGTTLISTALAGAAIDPRQATIVGGTSGAGIGTIVSTAAGSAAIDPRQATLQAGSSANTVGNVTVSTGSVALYSSTGGAIAVSTQTLSTDAMGFAVRVAAAGTSNTIGGVAVSTAPGGLRAFTDSTGTYNSVYYWTTGIVAAAAATMQSLNFTKNLSSGSSGTSFNVSAGKIFRIDNINGSIRLTSGTDLYADFAIRAVTTTGGATGANFPVFYYRLAGAVAESTNALAAGGGGADFSMTGLSIDLPSSASFGVSIVSNSTASQECTFAFGGKEFTI